MFTGISTFVSNPSREVNGRENDITCTNFIGAGADILTGLVLVILASLNLAGVLSFGHAATFGMMCGAVVTLGPYLGIALAYSCLKVAGCTTQQDIDTRNIDARNNRQVFAEIIKELNTENV